MRTDLEIEPRSANHVPLTPVDFLRRAVEVFPDKLAVIHGERRLTYSELGQLTGRIAAGLRRAGVEERDVVSVISGNRPEMLALHYAVPMVGAVLNTINTRLDVETIAFIFNHADSKLIIADADFCQTVEDARRAAQSAAPLVIIGTDAEAPQSLDSFIDGLSADPITCDAIKDEWQPLCLNYTSGTTGRPKGVVYHHRGAFLNTIGNVLALGFNERTVYLWILPMFHCNGWQHPFAVTAMGGTHVCLTRVDAAEILREIDKHDVTHFSCAPVVLYMLLHHADHPKRDGSRRVKVATGGAAPTTALIEGLNVLGFDLVHLYGLTESYGPATLCSLGPDLADATSAEKARFLARQGVRHPCVSSVDVWNADGYSVAHDGIAMGEIVLRSNTLMAGYYGDRTATEEAFAGGVFHTGDLAVRHPDGTIEIKDRAKDMIISGGENISSLEIESVLHQHPAVLLAAVVAVADEKWGEIPCACIELKSGQASPPDQELLAFCRQRLAHFKVPRKFLFLDLPKTATGKI